MEILLKQKLFYFFPVLFCFCLPFGSLVLSGIIALWLFVSFFNINAYLFVKGIKNKKFLLAEVFFTITVLSALVSSNHEEALFSIEVKLALLVLPYLFFCFKWPIDILRRCIIAFVSGCFFACLYLIARASLYAFDGRPDYFFYSLFSDFIHASYFSMYLIQAIVFVVLFYGEWFKTQKTFVYTSWFFVSVFITTIFLCSSKLGLISFFITMPLLLAYKWKSHLNMSRILIMIFSIVTLFIVLIKVFPESFNRFNSLTAVSSSTIDKTSSESTTVRILIWKEALGIIENNFITGTGVGDANDELYKAYEQKGITGAFEHKFNAHNQFLQTFIGIGVIGFVSLLMLTLAQLITGIIRKNILLVLFSLIIILNFMVESMLQKSAGVLFFTFFFCLFSLVNEKKLEKNFEEEKILNEFN